MAKHTVRDYNPFGTLPKKRELSEPIGIAPAPTVETVKQLNIQTGKRLAKSQDPAYTKFTTYIPIELHRAVKAKLVGKGRELSDLVEEVLREWNGTH